MSRDNVRGLMVYQPHAAMIVSGVKTVETRDWMPAPDSGVPEGWRGTLLIVSGPQNRETDDWSLRSFNDPLIFEAVDKAMRQEKRAKRASQGKSIFSDSCILGAVDVLEVRQLRRVMCPECKGMEQVRQSIPEVGTDWFGLVTQNSGGGSSVSAIDPLEFALGVYEPGRYIWSLGNPRRLPELIPFVGRRRLFEVPEEILQQIEAQGVTL